MILLLQKKNKKYVENGDINNNIINIEEKENEVDLGQNMVSCSTQTDVIQTDDEESENQY